MKAKTALKIILGIAIVGVLFSGFLSYNELFVGSCGAKTLVKCGTFKLADLPACVYGLIMYLFVLTFAALGLRETSTNHEIPKETI